MTTSDMFAQTQHQQETVTFEPTRQAGLARLAKFASRTGAHYASQRNYDFGPAHRTSVSALSPWIRHRLVTEEELLVQTLARHGPKAATKFIEEVFWRGYFKGWLEQHPSVWHTYQSDLRAAFDAHDRNDHLKKDYDDAIAGDTGIACFDHWCTELKATGYLHNHVRMWFASIWIFTLRLPWELGADFFLSHLIDGDPAANTISWRWIAGLHTKGKTYLARPSNIAKYTDGQFNPVDQLAQFAEPLVESYEHPLVPLTVSQPPPQTDFLLVIKSEDCQPESIISGAPAGVLGLCLPSEPNQGDQIHAFKSGAVADALARWDVDSTATAASDWTTAIVAAARRAGTRHGVTPHASIGPVATQLEVTRLALSHHGIDLHQVKRNYDALTWPHATKGYFKLKKKIPNILSELGLADA
jgi:deoxyribodipyrimidine photo-lyase